MEEPVFQTVYSEEIYSFPLPVTVLIGVAWNEIKEEQRQLLTKILYAVRLSPESVRIVHQSSLDLSVLPQKPKRVIAFLTPPKGISAYEIIHTGEAAMVFSDPLEILQSDEAAKRKLWSTLKTLFPP